MQIMKILGMYWVMALAVLFLSQGCNQDDLDIEGTAEYEEFLTDEMDFQNIPALSVIIFDESGPLYEKYLGQSNIAENRALAASDLFLMASISKVVTGTALLQLHEDGQFALDDNINDYLPFNVSVPNESTAITFRMLLTHTSGIADGSALDGQYYYGEDSPVGLRFFLENYLVPGGDFYNANENFHNFEPGTVHEYSNVGSALIGVLVEQISNKDFNTYCKENIFQPLGMTRTYWSLEEALQANQTIVQPYNYTNSGFESIQHYTFTDYPNGGLRTTGRDMLSLLRAFLQGGNSNGHQLLDAGTVNAMLTPQIPSIDNQVGLHTFVMNAEHNLWGHDGGEQGVATIMGFNRETKVGAIILVNQGDADLDELLVESYKLGLQL